MKKPVVLWPKGPKAWESHQIAHPELQKVWTALGWDELSLWFPRPKISSEELAIMREASHLVFPLGMAHYDGLWLVAMLREHKVSTPLMIMVTSDLGKGQELLKPYLPLLTNRDVLITNSEAEGRLWRWFVGSKVPVVSIPLPIDETLFSPPTASEKKNIRSKLNMGPGLVGIYAGRISAQKNLHSLFYLLSDLKATHPDFQFFIAGQSDDIGMPHLKNQNEWRYLHELAFSVQHWGLEENIKFVGHLSQMELASYLKASDFQVSTTLHSAEDFGLSVAQGMHCGLPTLVTKWGGGEGFASDEGVQGVPVVMTKNGPRLCFNAAKSSLKKMINGLSEKKHLSEKWKFKSICEAWKQLSDHCPKPQKLKFHASYKRLPLPCDPKNPIYLSMCELYGAIKLKGPFTYHPLYLTPQSFLIDPISGRRRIPLTPKEKEVLAKAKKPTEKSLGKKLFTKLLDAGVLLPAKA